MFVEWSNGYIVMVAWLGGGRGRKRQSFLQMTICGGTLVGRLGNNLNYCLACSSWNTSGPHLSQSTIRLVLPEEGGLFRFQIHLSSQQVDMWDVY